MLRDDATVDISLEQHGQSGFIAAALEIRLR
jgi:hypothetical protein